MSYSNFHISNLFHICSSYATPTKIVQLWLLSIILILFYEKKPIEIIVERVKPFHMNIVVFLSEYRMEDFIGRRYYKINKFLLYCVGLWSYQKTKRIQIQSIFIYTIFLSFIFVQVYKTFLFKYASGKKIYISELLIIWNCYYLQLFTFITMKYNMILFLKFISHFLPILLCVIKYSAYYINANKVSYISHINLIVSDLNF